MSIIINRILPWAVGALLFLGLELINYQVKFIYVIGGWLLVFIFLVVSYLFNWRFRKVDLWLFLIIPSLLLSGGLACLLILEQDWTRQGLIIFLALMETLLFFNLVSFLHQINNYQPYSLGNSLYYLNLAAGFFVFTSLFGLDVFLNLPLWLMLAILVIAILGLNLSWYKINQFDLKNHRFFWLFNGLITSELAITIWFWPTSYLIKGVVLTLIYYLLNGLTKSYIIKAAKGTFFRYLFFSGLVLLLLLLTARWT